MPTKGIIVLSSGAQYGTTSLSFIREIELAGAGFLICNEKIDWFTTFIHSSTCPSGGRSGHAHHK